MGDRGNICVTETQYHHNTVYLYTHWGGCNLPQTLQEGFVKARSRWNDHSYLTRILFCHMVKGYEDEFTGYGISSRLIDNEYPILVVNVTKQTVGLAHDKHCRGHCKSPETYMEINLEDYVNIENISWDKLESIKEQ